MINNLQRVLISSSPGYPDVVRKIAVIGKNEDYQNGSVTLICKIEHYDQNDNRLQAFKAIEVNPFLLVADNSSYVNTETGGLVFKDSEGQYPDGAVPQYDWLRQAVENGANPFHIAQGAIVEADLLGRFT